MLFVGIGSNLKEAKFNAYNDLEKIDFDGKSFRKDIGDKGIAYAKSNLEAE